MKKLEKIKKLLIKHFENIDITVACWITLFVYMVLFFQNLMFTKKFFPDKYLDQEFIRRLVTQNIPLLILIIYLLIVVIPERKKWFISLPFLLYYLYMSCSHILSGSIFILTFNFSKNDLIQIYLFMMAPIIVTFVFSWLTIVLWWNKDKEKK